MIVAVLNNNSKISLFSLEERIAMLKKATYNFDVFGFDAGVGVIHVNSLQADGYGQDVFCDRCSGVYRVQFVQKVVGGGLQSHWFG